MIDYSFFYDIAKYGNTNWKGNFSSKEIACNAYDYLTEYEYSKGKGKYHITTTIQQLLYLLDEDNSEECNCWANEIRKGLGLCQVISYKENKIFVKDGMARLMENLPRGTKIIIEFK